MNYNDWEFSVSDCLSICQGAWCHFEQKRKWSSQLNNQYIHCLLAPQTFDDVFADMLTIINIRVGDMLTWDILLMTPLVYTDMHFASEDNRSRETNVDLINGNGHKYWKWYMTNYRIQWMNTCFDCRCLLTKILASLIQYSPLQCTDFCRSCFNTKLLILMK